VSIIDSVILRARQQ